MTPFFIGDIMFYKSDSEESTVVKLAIICVFVITLVSFVYGFLDQRNKAHIAVEAIKAGLVEQPIRIGPNVWVHREDYKPYKLSEERQ